MAYNKKGVFSAHVTCPIQEDRRALLIIVIRGPRLKGHPPSCTLSVIIQQERELQKVSHQQLNALTQTTCITPTHNLSELVARPQPTIMARKYNPTTYPEGRDLGIFVDKHTVYPHLYQDHFEGSNVLFLYTV